MLGQECRVALQGWLFGSAENASVGASPVEEELLVALANVFGDCGRFEGSLAVVVDQVVGSLLRGLGVRPSDEVLPVSMVDARVLDLLFTHVKSGRQDVLLGSQDRMEAMHRMHVRVEGILRGNGLRSVAGGADGGVPEVVSDGPSFAEGVRSEVRFLVGVVRAHYPRREGAGLSVPYQEGWHGALFALEALLEDAERGLAPEGEDDDMSSEGCGPVPVKDAPDWPETPQGPSLSWEETEEGRAWNAKRPIERVRLVVGSMKRPVGAGSSLFEIGRQEMLERVEAVMDDRDDDRPWFESVSSAVRHGDVDRCMTCGCLVLGEDADRHIGWHTARGDG